MKSLLVTIDFPPVIGGVSHSLWNFAHSFSPSELVVLAPPSVVDVDSSLIIERRPFFFRTPLIWPGWLRMWWHVWRIVRKYRIQTIQAGQLLPVGTVALLIKRLLHVSYVVYVYGQDLVISSRSSRKKRLITSILKNATGIIANSQYTRKLAIAHGAVDKKTIIAYPSVPTHRYHEVFAHDLEAFRHAEQLDNAFVIVSVGNLVKRKGHDYMLQAVYALQGEIPNLRYLIVGKGPEGHALREQAASLDLKNFVSFAGSVSDAALPLYYSVADIISMPSREVRNADGDIIDVEGYGMVYREAGLYKKPVIAGRSGGVPEAVHDGVTGILVNPESVDEIVSAIRTLYTDSELRMRMGAAGKRAALYDHPTDIQTRKIHSLLNQI